MEQRYLLIHNITLTPDLQAHLDISMPLTVRSCNSLAPEKAHSLLPQGCMTAPLVG